MLLPRLHAASRGDNIPASATPLKMLLPRAPPVISKKKPKKKERLQCEQPRRLSSDVWVFCRDKCGATFSLGRRLCTTRDANGYYTMATTHGRYRVEETTSVVFRGKCGKRSVHGATVEFVEGSANDSDWEALLEDALFDPDDMM